MRVIAIANKKGGAGKTTTAVNLAAGLAEQGRRVLIIDLDEQTNATTWCEPIGYDRTQDRGVFDLFAERSKQLDEVIYPSSIDGLMVVPASHWLAGIDKALSQEPGAEQILKLKLRKLDKSKFDYVMIDCPPNLGLMTVNALNASSEVIIPLEASVLNLSGVAQILGYVEMVRERLNPDIRVSGILAGRFDVRTNRCKQVVKKIRDKYPELLFETVIHEDTKLAEAPDYGPIIHYEPKARSAEDFRKLVREVIGQEQPRVLEVASNV
jgi:chromosome partitioning protein